MRNRLITRKFLYAFLALAATGLVLVYPHSAAAINLKTNSVITDNTIKLSDIFLGLPERSEDRVLGPAPRPGQEMVLNARTLLRIATAMDLSWRPQHSGEYVVLSRSASIVDYDAIEDVLKSEIEQQAGMNGEYQIAFSGSLSEIILPPEQPASVDVQSISLRDGNTHFDAVLVAPSKEVPLQTMRVSGALHRMVEVPVLRETMRTGTVIGKRDIDYVSMREHELQHNMVINASELIGMTPRRMIVQGKPMKLNDLEAPQIVERGDHVVITFNHAGMSLTAQGKALESGAKGDPVRVANVASSRTVEAVVTAEREVTVQEF